jgi:hypothetical protein
MQVLTYGATGCRKDGIGFQSLGRDIVENPVGSKNSAELQISEMKGVTEASEIMFLPASRT